MTVTTLTPEQVHDVLQRAHEIEQTSLLSVDLSSDVNSVIASAEEAGVSRDAILQAMKEHLALVGNPPGVGELVFARTPNDKYYASEILRTDELGIRVRFLSGGEMVLPPKDIRPLAVVPGSKLLCSWPHWGLWNCTVLSYDAVSRKVRVTDNWGSEETFDLSEVQLDVRQFEPKQPGFWTKLNWGPALAISAGSGALGAIATWLFMR